MQCTLRIVCTLWVYLKNYAMLFLEKYLCEKWSNFIYDDGFLFAMHHRTTFVEGWWKTNTNRNLLIRFDKEQMKEEKKHAKRKHLKICFHKIFFVNLGYQEKVLFLLNEIIEKKKCSHWICANSILDSDDIPLNRIDMFSFWWIRRSVFMSFR